MAAVQEYCTAIDYKFQGEMQLEKPKKLFIAYLVYFIGGICGLHHFYLNRDRHGFVFLCTLGGYFGCGMIYDLFNMPRYVREANDDALSYQCFLRSANRRPPLSALRVTCQIFVGFLFGEMLNMATPPGLEVLYFLAPLLIALGVWNVGNIGRECGKFRPCCHTAHLTSYILYIFSIDAYLARLLIAISASLVFTFVSRKWRLQLPRHDCICVRVLKLLPAIGVYLALCASFLYFNASFVDDNGNKRSFAAVWNVVANADQLHKIIAELREYYSSVHTRKRMLDGLNHIFLYHLGILK